MQVLASTNQSKQMLFKFDFNSIIIKQTFIFNLILIEFFPTFPFINIMIISFSFIQFYIISSLNNGMHFDLIALISERMHLDVNECGLGLLVNIISNAYLIYCLIWLYFVLSYILREILLLVLSLVSANHACAHALHQWFFLFY